MQRLSQCSIAYLAGYGLLLLLQNGSCGRFPAMRMGQIPCRVFLMKEQRYSNTAARLHQKNYNNMLKTPVNKGLWPCACGQNASAGAHTLAGGREVAVLECSVRYNRATGKSQLLMANSERVNNQTNKHRYGDKQWNY